MTLIEKNKEYYANERNLKSPFVTDQRINARLLRAWDYVKDNYAYSECFRRGHKLKNGVWGYRNRLLNTHGCLYEIITEVRSQRGRVVYEEGSVSTLLEADRDKAAQMYEDMRVDDNWFFCTFCNLNLTTALLEYDAPDLAAAFLAVGTVNSLYTALQQANTDVMFSKQHEVCKVDYVQAAQYAKCGGLAFGIKKEKGRHGHAAPIHGWGASTDKHTNKPLAADNAFAMDYVPYFLNIGAESRRGWNSLQYAFYADGPYDLDYYLLLKRL